jgi:hypothetical protein
MSRIFSSAEPDPQLTWTAMVEMVMPFMTASEVTTLKFDKGWVTEASVEDVKLLPGVSRQMFRLEGGDWVEESPHLRAGHFPPKTLAVPILSRRFVRLPNSRS